MAFFLISALSSKDFFIRQCVYNPDGLICIRNKKPSLRKVQTVNKPLIPVGIRGLSNNKRKSGGKKEEKRLDEALDVLNCGGQETLLAHVLDAEHTSKAQAVIDLRFCK